MMKKRSSATGGLAAGGGRFLQAKDRANRGGAALLWFGTDTVPAHLRERTSHVQS